MLICNTKDFKIVFFDHCYKVKLVLKPVYNHQYIILQNHIVVFINNILFYIWRIKVLRNIPEIILLYYFNLLTPYSQVHKESITLGRFNKTV